MTGSGPFRYAVAWKALERAVQMNIIEKSLFCYDCYRYYGGAERSLLKRLLLPLPGELQFAIVPQSAVLPREKMVSAAVLVLGTQEETSLFQNTHPDSDSGQSGAGIVYKSLRTCHYKFSRSFGQ